MTDFVCVGVGVNVCVCVHVYISMHCVRWDKGTAGEKGPPPYLILQPHPYPPASRLCLSKLDFILQKQSGMNNSFSSPSFCLFVLSFLLSYFLFSLCLGISFFRSSSVFFFHPSLTPAVRTLFFCFSSTLSGKGLVDFVHGWVIFAVDVRFDHLSVWLNCTGCVDTHIAMLWSIKNW